MTNNDLIKEYLEKGGKIKVCPPANVAGDATSRATKQEIKDRRQAWRRSRAERCVRED